MTTRSAVWATCSSARTSPAYFGVATIGGFHADDRAAIVAPLLDI